MKKLLARLGPGFITGISDDDPAGIATYSQAGAAFGYAPLWTMLLAFPLMTAVQYVSGAIGEATGKGLAANLRAHYPRWIVYALAALIFVANTINLGADLGAMAAAVDLILPGPRFVYVVVVGVATVVMVSALSYARCARYFEWLGLSLLAYVASAVLAHADWLTILHDTFVPTFAAGGHYLAILVAIFGTTISPFLVIWESSEAVEHDRSGDRSPIGRDPARGRRALRALGIDTITGMAAATIVGWFIMITCAAALHAHGATDIRSAADAARALAPAGGAVATYIFAAGIIGTGLLSVPVLAGSAAFAVGEGFGWRVGLEWSPRRAGAFYGVIAIAVAVGIALNAIHVNIIAFLIATAVINGIVEVPVLALVAMVAGNARIMGGVTISRSARVIVWIALAVMTAAAVGAVLTL